MRRTTIALAVLAAALALPAAAAAKGPDQASISGPGLNGSVPITGEGESGAGTPLGDLVQFGGYFQVVFGQQPDARLPAAAAGRPRPALHRDLPRAGPRLCARAGSSSTSTRMPSPTR